MMRALLVAFVAAWMLKAYAKSAFKLGFGLVDDLLEWLPTP